MKLILYFIYKQTRLMILNNHDKKEYPPMHTAEHILNATMVQMFGCSRSFNAHIERKKSKCDYHLDQELTKDDISAIEIQVNKVIGLHLSVTCEFVNRQDADNRIDLSKLPEDASQTLRIVKVGDYDVCACIGSHVENTSEIGEFKITTYSQSDGVLRLRFKLV